MTWVSFAYPGTDRYVLKDIDLEVKPGELVVVGENGAGKTTLAKLLCRLYDPTAGVVSWDGVDYRDIDLNELRARIAVVFQDYARFPGSVRENVGAGALAHLEDDERITSVLRSVGLEDLATGSGKGLETPLTRALEGGTDLSGGQWQRIAIARAAVRPEAGLVVLDEPAASIDPQTEHEVLELLKVIAAGRCAVVISHRLALATFATKVVVMSGGRIAEVGSHEELMDRGGLYRTMFMRQASGYVSASKGLQRQ